MMRTLRTRTAEQAASATTATEPPATRTERPAPAGGAAAVGARATAGVFLVPARLLRAAASAIVLLIVVAIVLFDLKANASNSIVRAIHDGANFFASPFTDLFRIHGVRKSLTINWGVAAVVYTITGAIVAAIIASPARLLRPFRRY
jgi:hypothetical protein